MSERISITVKSSDKRCSKCIFGHQIVAGMAGGSINEDGSESRWHLMESIPVGQTRNCFDLWERTLAWLDLIKLNHFIDPGGDDTCVYPKRFKQKQANA